MAFSYKPLWIILVERDMTKEDLRKKIHASPTTIASMGKGEGISPKTLSKICEALDVQPGDIMTYVSENKRQRD